MSVAHAAKSLIGHLLRPVHAGDEKLTSQKQPAIAPTLYIHGDAFSDGAAIPQRYSQDGENISPALHWSGVPADAKELVLICEDPDAPMPQPFIHWILFGLSPRVDHLPEHVPTTVSIAIAGAAGQAQNSANKIGYVGPKPPIGHGPHHYHFQLFALNAPSDLTSQADRDAVTEALKGKVIAMGEVIGTYERT